MASPALRELQEAFWRSLAAAPGGDPDPLLVDAVAPMPPLDADARVAVYAGMYFARLLDALREDFPHVAALLGDEAFEALIARYVARHPSGHPSLRHLGGGLPALIASEPDPEWPPWTADVARLEWTRVDVFDAPDAVPLTADDLRRVPAEQWPALRFALVPAVATLVAGWPVHRLWSSEPPDQLAAGRTALRVWREGFFVYQAPMDRAEESLLERLIAGQPFAAMCEAADGPADAAALLLRWLEDGLIAKAW